MTLHKLKRRNARNHALKRGAPPGTAVYTGEAREEPVHVQVIDYAEGHAREQIVADASALAAFRSTRSVTWINLDGIHRVDEVQALCRVFDVHPLWVEDIVNPSTRAKHESLDDKVLIIIRMVHMDPDGALRSEQVSMVLGPGWVVTFQERPGDVWGSLRQRIQMGNGRVRRMKADYLLHALLDDIVDHYFLALERIEDEVDRMESLALDPEGNVDLHRIFDQKNALADFRRMVWPVREAVNSLLRMEGPITPETLPFFRDLYDHVVQVMDIVDTSRDRLVGVYELHLAVMGHRLNDIMKVLTIVSTIFIPMTFIAGVYGMNFDHMPELHWEWGYLYVWGLMLSSAVAGVGLMMARRWMA